MTIQHASDCAVHNEPAYPNGPCDCGAEDIVRDCRTCEHNSYKDLKEVKDWVHCCHPVTIERGPKWQAGDPAMVGFRTSDVRVRDLGDLTFPCSGWEDIAASISTDTKGTTK